MELNPIVTREVLARWRHFRSFGLLFAYSALLSAMVGIIYASGSRSETAAHRGHDLFVALTIGQVVGWMMLAPGLTATSIAGEREQGLLEAVQLSHLSGIRIAWGKLLSALFLVGLMLLVPLPIIAICFFTGGVSPAEFAIGLTLYSSRPSPAPQSAWRARPGAGVRTGRCYWPSSWSQRGASAAPSPCPSLKWASAAHLLRWVKVTGSGRCGTCQRAVGCGISRIVFCQQSRVRGA